MRRNVMSAAAMIAEGMDDLKIDLPHEKCNDYECGHALIRIGVSNNQPSYHSEKWICPKCSRVFYRARTSNELEWFSSDSQSCLDDGMAPIFDTAKLKNGIIIPRIF